MLLFLIGFIIGGLVFWVWGKGFARDQTLKFLENYFKNRYGANADKVVPEEEKRLMFYIREDLKRYFYRHKFF